MPTVHIPDNKKYEKALGILYRMGGTFRTKPTHVLVVAPAHYQAFLTAGLIEDGQSKDAPRASTTKSN